MKLHSVYLNPFQPFPERDLDSSGGECPRDAVEDNLSRAVFAALANAESPSVFAQFLEYLVRDDSSTQRSKHTQELANILRHADPSSVEIGLQSWPADAVCECDGKKVLLIGISSAHCGEWTHNQRAAPADPRPDAWVHVPGKMLLVFECKNDEHPLDATQVSAYAHRLGLLGHDVPQANPGSTLSPQEAQEVQKACANLVLDANWDCVVAALRYIQETESAGTLVRWLCDQAAAYIGRHVRPPYREFQTILNWLNGPDDDERRSHLRRLVTRMGEELAKSAESDERAITFDLKGMRQGAGAALYIPLRRGGKPLKHRWLGGSAEAVLWFQFSEGAEVNGSQHKPVGLEFYIQAPATQPNEKKGVNRVDAWNEASERHKGCVEQFEEAVAKWNAKACKVEVTTVRFKGRKRNWQGAGELDPDGPRLSEAAPQDALNFLKARRDELWRFPHVNREDELTGAASKVRKPALALMAMAPLETSALAGCHSDAHALQHELQKAVGCLTALLG